MKKAVIIILAFGIFGILGSFIDVATSITAITNKKDREYKNVIKQDILCLTLAYPEYIMDVEINDKEDIYLVMKSGKRILYDDKRRKSVEQKLINPDLQDMMEQIYPILTINKLADKDFDPGRCRVKELFSEVYGENQYEIKRNLINVKVGYKSCQFNKNNKAADSLKNVMGEMTSLVQSNRRISAYVFPTSGTFNYRRIAGTNRLSPHSYGVAIDLARDNHDYWQWATPLEGEKRLVGYPKEVVEVFERNNFIWGGKWQHFDILHFEYRPEIVLKGRYFGIKDEKKLWYEGAPFENPVIKEYINKIDKVLS